MDLNAILSGLGIGAIVPMTGVGGGSLMTPPQLSVFKPNPAVATGADLWFARIAKTASFTSRHLSGRVQQRVASAMRLAASRPLSPMARRSTRQASTRNGRAC